MQTCYQQWSTGHIVLRRALLILAALVVLLLVFSCRLRARYCSWLHRAWLKTGSKPVWLQQAEALTGDLS